MDTLSRRLMERDSATQAEVPHTTVNTEHVCITDDDRDIFGYIAGFALHRIRQKTYRLKRGVEKTTVAAPGGMPGVLTPLGQAPGTIKNDLY